MKSKSLHCPKISLSIIYDQMILNLTLPASQYQYLDVTKPFVYLELDLKHVWDMNLASDFDAGYANFSAWNEF